MLEGETEQCASAGAAIEGREQNSGTGFIHLHAHSYYSFFDSTLSPEQLVELACKDGQHAVALTDTNCMTGAVVFYSRALKAKLKPILGAEITQPLASERKLLKDRESSPLAIASGAWLMQKKALPGPYDDLESDPLKEDRSGGSLSPSLCHGDRSRRAILLARSFDGYSEICDVVTRRMLDPHFDLFGTLCKLSEQVIVLSDSPEVLETCWNFGSANAGETHDATPGLYALLTASRRSRTRNREVYECARRMGVPLVAGCDVKLATPEDTQLHNLLQAMRRLTTVYQLKESDKIDPAQHFQSAAQVARFFGISRSRTDQELFSDLRQAMANTLYIAEQCNCELPLREWKFPRLPEQVQAPEKELRELVLAGMKKRYGDPVPLTPRERMNSELEVIERLNFTEYFLLVNRIVSEAHKRGFFTVGRGSGANSILSYALGFTEVCPLKFSLYFERFLNPDRSAPPDIDIDFSWKERDELIEWCFEHFGQDRVALICTIQTLQGRQSIREVGKALGLSESEVNAFNQLQETRFHVEEPVSSGASTQRRVFNLAEQEPWRTVLQFARRIQGFPRHLSIHCGGILITPEPVTKFLPLTRSAKGFVITQMDMFSVEELGLIKIDLLSNRSLGVLKDSLRMAERNLHAVGAIGGGLPRLTENTDPITPEDTAKVQMFQREAMRMKLAGTRRGTSVALAGVLGSFATCVSNTVANELVPQGQPITVREKALSFESVTNDAATRQVIDQGLTMGCFYIESPGMRALFERLRCKNFEEVVTASSIIRPGVAESGMMQEYIARHQEKHPKNYAVQLDNYKVVDGEGNSEDAPDQQDASPSGGMAAEIQSALPQIEPLSVTLQVARLQRETERAGLVGSRSGARVAVALGVTSGFNASTQAATASIGNAPFADQRAPVTLLPPASASERLATGRMPINAHAKSRALEEYFAPSTTCCDQSEIQHQDSKFVMPVEAIQGYAIQPQGRRSLNPHGPDKKLRIHHLMMELLPETYGVMVYQEDVLRVAHDLAGMSYAEADLLRRAISGKMRSRDALLEIQDNFVNGVLAKGLPREDAEEIWRQMASFAGYSFCKGHSAAFAVLSYQVGFMKAHFPAEFFAGVLTNQGGFYGAHAYLQEARRWGLEIQPPCVNGSRLEYTGQTFNAAAAREAAGLTKPAAVQQEGDSFEKPAPRDRFALPLGTGRTGWVRIGMVAIQGIREEAKQAIVRERDEGGVFASTEDLMSRTGLGLEECRTLVTSGALDSLADDQPAAEMWKPKDPRRVLQKRRALLLKVECMYRAKDAGLDHGFVKLTFPIWKNPEAAKLHGESSTTDASSIAALQELCKLEADALNFTVSAHPLDLVDIPREVIPAREIRSYNHKRIYMAGWMISAKLLGTKTTGQAMKMLTLEDNSGTFEAVLFPRVYARFAPRTLGRGPYLVCGKVDMTLGSPTLNVEKLEILPNKKSAAYPR